MQGVRSGSYEKWLLVRCSSLKNRFNAYSHDRPLFSRYFSWHSDKTAFQCEIIRVQAAWIVHEAKRVDLETIRSELIFELLFDPSVKFFEICWILKAFSCFQLQFKQMPNFSMIDFFFSEWSYFTDAKIKENIKIKLTRKGRETKGEMRRRTHTS